MYEQKILDLVNARLNVGFERYGGFDPNCGKRWATEALEEVMDGLVYCAGLLIQLEENMSADTKQQIGAETIQRLQKVVDACEAGKLHERLHRPLGSAKAISEFCDLAEKIRDRISRVDGSEEREHREELDRVCSTRSYWFPSQFPDMSGLSGCDFQRRLNSENKDRARCKVTDCQGDRAPRTPRASCHDPAIIKKHDAERLARIVDEIVDAGAPISVNKACKASGLRSNVIPRLWAYGVVEVNEQGLVDVVAR